LPAVAADLFEVTLPAALGTPAAARAAFTAWMAGRVSATMLADAQLLLGELVTNSVRHADAADDAVVSVRAQLRPDGLRLEIKDRGSIGPIARRLPDRRSGGGFGLDIVEVLSRRWGVNRDAGTCVWADLAFPATG
jgi:anti-sigma regulatory factor (Ser/Thr protein kinase)